MKGPDRPLPPSDRALVETILAEIAARGPLTFARFMELALYHPERGYYTGAAARAIRGGDFLTAPEMDPIFGRTLARPVAETWELLGRPDPFTIVEYGAGSGALAAALVEGLVRVAPAALAALRYAPVELNRHRLAELRARFEAARLAERLVDAETLDERPAEGVVLANEFLDALPVHRLQVHRGRLRERYVDRVGLAEADAPDAADTVGGAAGDDDAADPAAVLVERLGPPSSLALAARLAEEGVALAEGQQAEVCLAMEPWLDEVSRRLGRGLVLVVDYGAPAAELYGPRHLAGTLLAYASHGANEDVLRGVGRQDLTAHVDLTALGRAATARGFAVHGPRSQQAFLVAAGLAEELAELRADEGTDLAAWASARSAVGRLLDPRHLGGFQVLGLARGLPSGGGLAAFDAPVETGG